MFWPQVEDVRSQLGSARAWEGGPTAAELVVEMLPMVRAYFLLGYQCLSINLGFGSGPAEPAPWMSYSLEGGTWGEKQQPFLRPFPGYTVAFELTPILDRAGFSYAVPLGDSHLGGTSVDRDGKVPAALLSLRDGFLELLTRNAAALVRAGVVTRGAGFGMVWIFDCSSWSALRDDPIFTATLPVEVLHSRPESFLKSQMFGDRAFLDPAVPAAALLKVPSLKVWDRKNASTFWEKLALAIQARGEASRYRVEDRRRHRAANVSVLDAIIDLARDGVIDLSSVIEPRDPPEPITPVRSSASSIDLAIWGEEQLIGLRAVGGRETLDGAVAWDYAPGDATQAPKIVIVAGRGVEVISPDSDSPARPAGLPWEIEVWRVQTDALVPPAGVRVDPSSMFSPAMIDDKVAVYMKPDGVFIEYCGERTVLRDGGIPTDSEGVDLNTLIPFCVEITFDPFCGSEAFSIDAYLETYIWGTPLGHEKPIMHLEIWATPGVTIEANGVSVADPLLPWLLGFPDNERHDTSQSFSFRASAAAWEVRQDPMALPPPWRATIPRASADGQRVTATWGIEAEADGQLTVQVKPHSIGEKTFAYEDSFIFDVIDLVVGFIPGIGDAVDIAETVVAWSTGKDKWGRPVSSFELVVMTVCAATPIVPSAVGRAIADALTSRGTGFIVRGGERSVFGLRALVQLLPGMDEQLVRNALDARRPHRAGSDPSDFIDTLRRTVDPRRVKDVATRLVEQGDASFLTRSDLIKADGSGFHFHSLDAAYERWLRSAKPPRTPERFLKESQGRVAQIARALLEPTPGEFARHAPRDVPHPSGLGRAIGQGASKALDNDSATEILDELRSMAGGILDGSIPMSVRADLGLVPVSRTTALSESQVMELAERLLRRLSPTSRIEDIPAAELERLFGASVIPNDERALRILDALFTAEREIGPAELARMIESDEFLAYAWGIATRYGYEHGLRFELWFAPIMRALPDTMAQVRLRKLRGTALAPGPDNVIGATDVGFIELKSVFDIDTMIDGDLSYAEDALKTVCKVQGPELPRQALLAQLRVLPWGNKIPGPDAAPPVDGMPPSDISKWRSVGTRHAFVLNDDHLVSVIFTRIADAAFAQADTSRVLASEIDLPPRLRDAFAAEFPTGIDVTDSTAVRAKLTPYLWRAAAEIERELNDTMSLPEIKALLGGREHRYRILLASEVSEDPSLIVRAVQP